MSEKHEETVDEILAEMRRGWHGNSPFAYVVHEHEAVECKDVPWGFSTMVRTKRVTIENLHDRLSVALARERGNTSRMREALEFVRDRTADYQMFDHLEREMHIKAGAALAVHPRNCDRPDCRTWPDACQAFEKTVPFGVIQDWWMVFTQGLLSEAEVKGETK